MVRFIDIYKQLKNGMYFKKNEEVKNMYDKINDKKEKTLETISEV